MHSARGKKNSTRLGPHKCINFYGKQTPRIICYAGTDNLSRPLTICQPRRTICQHLPKFSKLVRIICQPIQSFVNLYGYLSIQPTHTHIHTHNHAHPSTSQLTHQTISPSIKQQTDKPLELQPAAPRILPSPLTLAPIHLRGYPAHRHLP